MGFPPPPHLPVPSPGLRPSPLAALAGLVLERRTGWNRRTGSTQDTATARSAPHSSSVQRPWASAQRGSSGSVNSAQSDGLSSGARTAATSKEAETA
ncbi:hypothetical protein LUX34_18280 [Streptomyces werraensis]|nr:hypothetical protein [Streptomyces werraensis]